MGRPREEKLCQFGEELNYILEEKNITPSQLATTSNLAHTVISDTMVDRNRRLTRNNVLSCIEGLISLQAIDEYGAKKLLRAASADRIADMRTPLKELDENNERDAAILRRLWEQQRRTTTHHPDLLKQHKELIGRDKVIADIIHLLKETPYRLFTLTGPPGVGKTHLALKVAKEVEGAFSDGITYVSLALVKNAQEVTDAIAQELGIPGAHEIPHERVIAALSDQYKLLLLDNFEHLIGEPDKDKDARGLVTALYSQCHRVKILVTSDEALHLGDAEEQVIAVPPLAAPLLNPLPQLSALLKHSAVQLFVQRAKERDGRFALDEKNAFAVSALCVILDGLPLALEIAASWISRGHSPERLLEEFQEVSGLSKFKNEDYGIPERHVSLNELFNWSYTHLKEDERKLFRRVPVFFGGCTRDAVHEVCSLEGDLKENMENLIASLIGHHLLEADPQGNTTWYWMLNTIHQYALSKLEGEERISIINQHRDYYLQIAEQSESKLKGHEQKEWFHKLTRAQYNLEQAIQWSLRERQQTLAAMQLVGGLGWYWYASNASQHGIERIFLALEIDQHPLYKSKEFAAAYGKASYYLVALALNDRVEWDMDFLVKLVDSCISAYQDAEDKIGVALALAELAVLISKLGDVPKARTLLEKSCNYLHKQGSVWGEAWVLEIIGATAFKQQDFEQARIGVEKSLELFLLSGDQFSASTCFHALGDLAFHVGDYEKAEEYYLKLISLYKEIDILVTRASALRALGWVALHCKKHDEALNYFEQACRIFWHYGQKQNVLSCYVGQAQVLKEILQPDERQLFFFPINFEGLTLVTNDEILAVITKGANMSREEAITYTRIFMI